MHFLIDFLIYLTAFALGAGLTWLVVGRRVRYRTADAATAAFAAEPEVSRP